MRAVAIMLRSGLIQVTGAKLATVGKNEKMEAVYEYLTGTGFKQRVEGILDSCKAMKEHIDKEKRAYTKSWAQREKEIENLLTNTIKTHGDLQGIMGKSLPEIKQLELSSGAEGELFND